MEPTGKEPKSGPRESAEILTKVRENSNLRGPSLLDSTNITPGKPIARSDSHPITRSESDIDRSASVGGGQGSGLAIAPASVEGIEPVEFKHAENDLVRRIVAGEEAAFDEFAAEFVPRLYRFAASRIKGSGEDDRELVRDIVQTTLCKAISKLSTFRGEARLFTWLCACCRNEILMHFRSADRRARHVEWTDVDELSVPAARHPEQPHEAYSAKERSQLVHQALDLLPNRYAQVLEWKYMERVSVNEIALRLSCGLKAAESLLTRARGAFKTTFRAAQGLPLASETMSRDAFSD